MISVITPTYNCGKFLKRSYVSLKNQTFKNWEWVVVNDGSSDHTDRIMRELLNTDSRIKYYELAENYGRGYARSIAVNKSSGSIIAIWDVDDLYTPNRLYEINDALKSGYDFFCSFALIVDNNLHLKGARHFYQKNTKLQASFVHPTLAYGAHLKNIVTYDKSMRAGEDFLVMLTLKNNYKGYYCEKYLLIYSEDREVNLSKTIEANLCQLRSIIKLFKYKYFRCGWFEKNAFVVNRVLKIFLLTTFRFYPEIYLKTLSHRLISSIDPAKLQNEHLNILREANDK